MAVTDQESTGKNIRYREQGKKTLIYGTAVIGEFNEPCLPDVRWCIR